MVVYHGKNLICKFIYLFLFSIFILILIFNFFSSALQKSGLAPSPQDTRALFLEFDTDGSNEISYSEFLGALRVSFIFKIN